MSLIEFVRESNKIEGIMRDPSDAEILATEEFVLLDDIKISDLEKLVSVFQPGNRLRDKAGLNVRVGNHIPPVGGPRIRMLLSMTLDEANDDRSPYLVHHDYETLHPFTDGNGRSGRALWLWQMKKRGALSWATSLGFLHAWYYQSLANSDLRK
jgi:hypothetical protein